MKKSLTFFICFLITLNIFGQVPNDDCITSFDLGVFALTPGNPPCNNGAYPWVGHYTDLSLATPSTPYYYMTGCQGYDTSTTTFADDAWFKYKTYWGQPVWISSTDTLHLNFYHGTSCGNLLPSGCFTYIPAYLDTMIDIFMYNDTSYNNYVQISSNVPNKQPFYVVCYANNMFGLIATVYGTIHINNTTSVNEITSANDIEIFPNPTTGELSINNIGIEKATFILYDVTARIITELNLLDNNTINLDNLLKGVYFYAVRNKYGLIDKGKIIKN